MNSFRPSFLIVIDRMLDRSKNGFKSYYARTGTCQKQGEEEHHFRVNKFPSLKFFMMILSYCLFSERNLNFQELEISVHSITGGLKQFFTLLPDPLVPVAFYQQILDSMGKWFIVF